MERVSGVDVAERDRACRRAPVDWRAGLEHARRVDSPWYRCQALASVGRYAPDSEVVRFCEEACESAARAKDAYQRVAAMAWPLRALIERDCTDLVMGRLPALLNEASEIESLASRSEALFLLFQAVFPGGPELWRPAFEALARASAPLVHWRQRRNLRDALLIITRVDPVAAREAQRRIEDGRLVRQIERMREQTRRFCPREFFWERAVVVDGGAGKNVSE